MIQYQLRQTTGKNFATLNAEAPQKLRAQQLGKKRIEQKEKVQTKRKSVECSRQPCRILAVAMVLLMLMEKRNRLGTASMSLARFFQRRKVAPQRPNVFPREVEHKHRHLSIQSRDLHRRWQPRYHHGKPLASVHIPSPLPPALHHHRKHGRCTLPGKQKKQAQKHTPKDMVRRTGEAERLQPDP
jgi:hypothetical protein